MTNSDDSNAKHYNSGTSPKTADVDQSQPATSELGHSTLPAPTKIGPKDNSKTSHTSAKASFAPNEQSRKEVVSLQEMTNQVQKDMETLMSSSMPESDTIAKLLKLQEQVEQCRQETDRLKAEVYKR